jgi:hypothetical protein
MRKSNDPNAVLHGAAGDSKFRVDYSLKTKPKGQEERWSKGKKLHD